MPFLELLGWDQESSFGDNMGNLGATMMGFGKEREEMTSLHKESMEKLSPENVSEWKEKRARRARNLVGESTGTPGFSKTMAEASTQGEGIKTMGMTEQDMAVHMERLGKTTDTQWLNQEGDADKNEAVQRFLNNQGHGIGVDKKIMRGGETQQAWKQYLQDKFGENPTPELRSAPDVEPPDVKPVEIEGKPEQGGIDSRMEAILKKQKQFARRRVIMDAVAKARPQGARFSFRS